MTNTPSELRERRAETLRSLARAAEARATAVAKIQTDQKILEGLDVAIGQLRRELVRLETEIERAEQCSGGGDPVTRHPAGNITDPDYSGSEALDFDSWPMDVPRPNPWHIPPAAGCTWIVEPGKATCQRDGTIIEREDGEDIVRALWLYHVEQGWAGPCIVGIKGNGGQAYFGGLYGRRDSWSVCSPRDTNRPIDIEVVGLDDRAELTCAWNGGKFSEVERLGLYNIGLRGRDDTFALRCKGPVGDIVLDGVWGLGDPDVLARTQPGGWTYSSFMHVDGCRSLVLANLRMRGEHSDDPPLKIREHWLYQKEIRVPEDDGPGVGLWLLHNEFANANRTGSQARPELAQQPDGSAGDAVYMGNLSVGLGWEFDGADGGYVLTNWQCQSGRLLFLGNDIRDARYGCIGALTQPPHRAVLNDHGYAQKQVHLFGNNCSNPRASRDPVIVSGAQELHLWGENTISGERGVVVDNEWNHKYVQILTGKVVHHGPPDERDRLSTWDPSSRRVVRTTAEALNAR